MRLRERKTEVKTIKKGDEKREKTLTLLVIALAVCMVSALDSFFEETLKEPDFVVTCKNKDGVVQFTETVKGKGYTPISMKNDFAKIYPDGITKAEK